MVILSLRAANSSCFCSDSLPENDGTSSDNSISFRFKAQISYSYQRSSFCISQSPRQKSLLFSVLEIIVFLYSYTAIGCIIAYLQATENIRKSRIIHTLQISKNQMLSWTFSYVKYKTVMVNVNSHISSCVKQKSPLMMNPKLRQT